MRNFFKQQNKSSQSYLKNRGFTLVETLVSISIFTVSILVIISVLATGITNTNNAKKKITAAYLAQEGIEYMRNLRDTYVLYTNPNDSTAGWNAFKTAINNSTCNTTDCYFNADNVFSFPPNNMPMTQITLSSCGGSCPELRYDSSTGRYGYTGSLSGYNRKVRMVVSADEVKVSSTVSWTQGSGNYSATFSESLFNWVE